VQLDIDWKFHPQQWLALKTLAGDGVDELLYGGAKGGGKTVMGVRWAFSTALEVIKKYKLKPTKYPTAIGFMGRKRGSDFRTTTLETWKREVPADAYVINEQKKEIVVLGTLKWVFGGFDDRGDVEKFNSAEYAFGFIDQAEEVGEDEIGMLRGSLRLKIKGKAVPHKLLLTANPAQCWLKREFVKQGLEKTRRRFIQALPGDNPYLPPDYDSQLDVSFSHRPELLQAYKYGSWDALEADDVIIKDSWLEKAKLNHFHIPPNETRRLVVADIARFGDDETIIYYQENTKVIDHQEYGQKGADYTAGQIAAMANKYKKDGIVPLIALDADGLGGPVADFLASWGFEVKQIQSASKSNEPDRFYNLRAEMWWTAGEKYANADIEEDFVDDELARQLTVPKWFWRNGRILVEAKADIKKRLGRGRSPDRADTRIMGLYAIRFASPIGMRRQKGDAWDNVPDSVTAMAG